MEKLPKPRISIPSPRQRASTIESNIWQIRSSARPCGSLARSAIRSIRSALVIATLPTNVPGTWPGSQRLQPVTAGRRIVRQSGARLGGISAEDRGAAEVRAQGRRHVDAPVGPLVGLEDANQGAGERQARPVEGVDEARLLLACRGLEPDLGAAGLEIAEVGAGADLQPFAAAGGP